MLIGAEAVGSDAGETYAAKFAAFQVETLLKQLTLLNLSCQAESIPYTMAVGFRGRR